MAKLRVSLTLDEDLADRVKTAAEIDERNVSNFLARLVLLAMNSVEAGDLGPESDWTDGYRKQLIDLSPNKEDRPCDDTRETE